MAKLLWGKVYFGDVFAGLIREEPDGRMVFAYDESFIDSGRPAVAHTLPVRPEREFTANGGMKGNNSEDWAVNWSGLKSF